MWGFVARKVIKRASVMKMCFEWCLWTHLLCPDWGCYREYAKRKTSVSVMDFPDQMKVDGWMDDLTRQTECFPVFFLVISQIGWLYFTSWYKPFGLDSSRVSIFCVVQAGGTSQSANRFLFWFSREATSSRFLVTNAQWFLNAKTSQTVQTGAFQVKQARFQTWNCCYPAALHGSQKYQRDTVIISLQIKSTSWRKSLNIQPSSM